MFLIKNTNWLLMIEENKIINTVNGNKTKKELTNHIFLPHEHIIQNLAI